MPAAALRAVLDALDFAAQKHRDQRRKDADASPYINHLIAVTRILATEGEVTDNSLLVAAALHDTIEDTETSFDELHQLFGPAVAGFVREVTDDKSLPKSVRKESQVRKASLASRGAKQIKIADKIANIRDILNAPPAQWSIERKLEYLSWSERVAKGCAGVNRRLDSTFASLVADARSRLDT